MTRHILLTEMFIADSEVQLPVDVSVLLLATEDGLMDTP